MWQLWLPFAMPKDTENSHRWGRLASPPRHTSEVSSSVAQGDDVSDARENANMVVTK